VDPRVPAINLLPVQALDQAAGKETVSSIAKGQLEAEAAGRIRQLMAVSPARMREALEVIRSERGRGVSLAAARVLMEPLGEWMK